MYPLYAIQRALPTEIINVILHYHGEFDYSRQKLRLVCKAWNKLVLTTSDMWTDVVIDEHSTLAVTLITLQRSNKRPLNISVILPDNKDVDISRFAFIPYILDHEARRIASLHVEGVFRKHFISALCSQAQLSMPRLHTLTFIMNDKLIPFNNKGAIFFDPIEENIPNPYPILLQCPSNVSLGAVDKAHRNILINAWGSRMYPALHDVTIIGVPLDWTRFPLTNLTELRLVNQYVHVDHPPATAIHPADVLRLLSRTLQVLELSDFVYDFAHDSLHWGPIELTHLRSLTLRYTGHPSNSTAAVTIFLGVLIAPNLLELSITNGRVLSGFKSQLPPAKMRALIKEAEVYDEDLLTQVMEWYPIYDLERLTLDCVVFNGDSKSLRPSTILRRDIEQPWIESRIQVDDLKIWEKDAKTGEDVLRDPPFALGFVRMLESVRYLDIRDPTGHFLYYMNYPIEYQEEAPYVLFNLSMLETMKIHTPDLRLALAFMEYRKRIQPEVEVDVYPGMKRRIIAGECRSACEFAPMARSSSEGEVREMVDGWYEAVNGWPEERLEDGVV